MFIGSKEESDDDLEECLRKAGACVKRGDLAGAEEILQALRQRYPDNAIVLKELGDVCRRAGKLEEALDYLRESVEQEPTDAWTHNTMGIVLQNLYRSKDAELAYRRAVEADPHYAAAHSNLLSALERLNKLDEAAAHVEQARMLCPESNLFDLREATILGRKKEYAKAIALLEKHNYPQDSMSRICAYNELGKLYEKAGNYDEAYRHFEMFAEMATKDWNITEENKAIYLGRIEKGRQVIDEAFVKGWRPAPRPGNERVPAFVVGFPRSGTTLVQHMLSSHPLIHSTEEIPALQGVSDILQQKTGNYPACLAELDEAQIRECQAFYFSFHRQQPDWEEKELLVDKFPLSIIYAGLIHRLFPDSRFILSLRHPCACIWSAYTQIFSPNEALLHTYTLDDTVNLYCRLMDLWFHFEEVLPVDVLHLKYEELVDDPENEIRKTLAFLDMPWDESVLEFHSAAIRRGDIRTPSYSQVSQGIYTDAKSRWLNYKQYLEPYLKTLEPYASRFGYEL